MKRDDYRTVDCPWCNGDGYRCIRTDGNTDYVGCVPCGGTDNTAGTGQLAVLFEPPKCLTTRR